MTEHQERLWQSMIDFIQAYVDGETNNFCAIVGRLEGALDASEIKDEVLISQWYDYWTPLEIRRAIEGNNVDKGKAIEELNAMKLFLQKKKVWNAPPGTPMK